MKALCIGLFWGMGLWAARADDFPVRIDSDRPGAVYIHTVGGPPGYQLLNPSTPAVIEIGPGQRIDVKVTSLEGLFRWQGSRQNLSGPANITVRLERGLAWERLAGLMTLVFTVVLAFLWSRKRKATLESTMVRSQLLSLEQRVTSAERLGTLAKTLGDYQVLAKLGAGAMGVVYKVENPEGQVFAAKVPNHFDQRVYREAQVSESLDFPNIVRCFGLVAGDPSFLLLEYLQGCTLKDRLDQGEPLGWNDIYDLIGQTLDAVEYAHSKGVLHRDLKPENVFLVAGDKKHLVKVMDFGLAASVHAARLTKTGEAMGTPVYASPEQLSGNPVDATTDLYSVGVILYELCTGRVPWSQLDPVALTMAKLRPLPHDPSHYRADLPEGWNDLILELLQGDPLQRPACASQLKVRWNRLY